ncbi:NFX1-type zinc finger-containing protein 1-like [Dysidea avara]|uniref:NFX1-type zinc finger-containing protein 1-like n=1 Tax=Dysidea avara TaxID=196820 RepID=UPI003328204C
MRPEIAELIWPHIYETLRNAPKVCDYPDVMGVKYNVYFISHTNPEDDCSDDSMSHSNKFEAQFCIELCKYFLKCGYRRNQITILTMYSGQLLKMKKLMPRSIFEGIKVTSVDNFQGEENDIIILSLVRGNNRKTVGFLKESNRVCVALSRAKMGLFVIGNFSLIKEAGGKVWKAIICDMEEKELVGAGLPLYCSTHNITTIITSIDDFVKVPEGGCNKICGIELPCGHFCPQVCHRIMDHSTYKCKEKCHKVLSCSHLCQSDCYECTRGCRLCPEMVTRKLPCGHTCEMECHVQLDSYRCHEHVERALPCGHISTMECCIEPYLYKCRECVERTLPCGHIIATECYVKLNLIKCHEPCIKILSCGHKCKEECHMVCTCQEPVTKMLLCGHFALNEFCGRPISEIKCKLKCIEILSCGHPCSGNCHSCYMGRLHTPCHNSCSCLQPCGEFTCINMHKCPIPSYVKKAVFLVRSSVHGKNWRDCIEKYVDMIEEKIIKHNKVSRSTHKIAAIYFQAKNLPLVFKLLDFTHKVYKMFEFATENVKVYTTTIKDYTINLCDYIANIQYLSEQAKIDSKSEFNRLFMLIQLCQLCDIISITCIFKKDDYKLISDIAYQLLNAGTSSSNKVTDDRVSDIFCKFKDIEKKYKIGDITKQETLLDIKMIGLCKCRWYNCSNGHYFSIRANESDMQTVKCCECIDLEIKYTITSVNQHASTMDD